jgi:hypothetical protein
LNTFPITHDVDFLLEECKKIDPNDFNIELGSLAVYGVKLRYPDDFYIPNKNETIKNIDIALNVKKIIESKIVL